MFTEFESKFIKASFSYLFRQYIEKTVDNIHHPKFMNKWKSNIYKAAYERNLERRVALPSERSVLDICDDETYFPQKICEEVMWF